MALVITHSVWAVAAQIPLEIPYSQMIGLT
jgi:hypothetical protein